MTRQTLTSGVPAALAESGQRVGYMFRIAFPSLTVYCTSMGFPISFGGNVYRPEGGVLAWSGINESTDLKARGVSFTLAATPAIKAAILGDNFHNSPCDVWLVAFDANWQMIGGPSAIARGLRMSECPLDDAGESATAKLTCETGAIEGTRDSRQYVSGPSHQLRYPGDTAFDRIDEVAMTTINWGGATQRVPNSGPALPLGGNWRNQRSITP